MSQLVFICYARVDQSFALPLAEQLKARGVAVWIDQLENQVSDDWDRDIDRALRDCSHLIIVLSPASVESREVRGELRTALDLGKPVLPVLYQPCQIPRQLRVVQFVDFTKRSADDELALGQLLRALQPGGARPVNPLGPPGPLPPSPAVEPSRPSRRTVQFRPITGRARALVGLSVAAVLLAAAWFGLDMALEPRRRLNDASLSPDGVYLAAVTGQGLDVRGALRVWDVRSGQRAATIPIEGPVWVCEWSPDGTRLAVGDHAGIIHIYDRDTWRTQARLTGLSEMVRFVAWSPDGATIATGDSNGSLWVWNVGTGALTYSKPIHTGSIYSVAWSPTGFWLATGSADRSVAFIEPHSGKVVEQPTGHAGSVTALAFSAEGRALASASLAAPYLMVWNESRIPRNLDGHSREVERVAWSKDRRFLASAGKDNLVHVWDANQLTLVQRVNLAGQYNNGKNLAWSRDGTRLAIGDSTGVRILDPQRAAPLSSLPQRLDELYGSIEVAGWSADGRRLATFNRHERTSAVWDVERAMRLQTFRVGLWQSLFE